MTRKEMTSERSSSLLRSPDFRRFFTACLLSEFGDRFRLVSLTLWVFVGSDEDPVARVTLLLFSVAPALLLGLFSGVLADRGNQRTIMVLSDVLRAGCSCLLIVSFWSDSLPLVYLAVTAASLIDVFFASSAFALLPRIVPGVSLSRANGVLESGGQAVAVLAPMLAGMTYVAFGPALAFAVDALTYVLSAVLLATIGLARPPEETGTENGDSPPPDTATPPARRRSTAPLRAALRAGWQESREGLAYLRTHPVAKWFILTVAGLTITSNANSVALIFLLSNDLHAPLSALGFVFSLNGLVAVLSALAVTAFAGRIDQGRLLVGSLTVIVLSQLGMGLAPSVWYLSLFVMLSAVANAPYSIAYDTVLQSSVDREFLGRVDGIDNMFSAALQVVVLLGAGLLTELVGARWVFVVSGLAGGACALVGVAYLVPRLRTAATVTG